MRRLRIPVELRYKRYRIDGPSEWAREDRIEPPPRPPHPNNQPDGSSMADGRPTKLTEEMRDDICTRIASGESLRSICADESMPSKSTVMLWVANDRDGFSDHYEKACLARAHFWADELLDIADDGTNDWMERTDKEGDSIGWQVNGEAIQRSRLRIDSRKWLLSKMLPKFADKQQLEHTNPDGSMRPTHITLSAPDEHGKD